MAAAGSPATCSWHPAGTGANCWHLGPEGSSLWGWLRGLFQEEEGVSHFLVCQTCNLLISLKSSQCFWLAGSLLTLFSFKLFHTKPFQLIVKEVFHKPSKHPVSLPAFLHLQGPVDRRHHGREVERGEAAWALLCTPSRPRFMRAGPQLHLQGPRSHP